MIVALALPADQQEFRPDPFPGSEAAFAAGCTCPQHQPWPGNLHINEDCPVHELERVKS